RVLRLDGGDLLAACLEPVDDMVQDLLPVRLAHARPGALVEGPAGGRDGALRVPAARARDARPGLLGRGVDRVGGLPALGVRERAVDVEPVLLHGWSPHAPARWGAAAEVRRGESHQWGALCNRGQAPATSSARDAASAGSCRAAAPSGTHPAVTAAPSTRASANASKAGA